MEKKEKKTKTDAVEKTTKVKKVKKVKKIKKNITSGIAFVQATFNNTIVTITDDSGNVVVEKLNWKGQAKKSGLQIGDIISNFKIENPHRPNKVIVYPFALLLLLMFGYTNYKFGKKSPFRKTT